MTINVETARPKSTTVRRRILIAVGAMILGITAVLVVLQTFQRRQSEVLAQRDCDDKSLIFSKLVMLNSSTLKSIDFDNSYWDDMVAFTKSHNMKWATRNIDSIIDPDKVDGLFIYGADSKLIYSSVTPDITPLKQTILPSSYIAMCIKNKQPTHCFVKTTGHVVEVFGQTIVPSNDQPHSTRPFGYLIAARLWDDDYVSKLSEMTGARATMLAFSRDDSLEASSTTGDVISFSHGCFDTQGKQIGRLFLVTPDHTFTALTKSSQRLILYLAGFGTILILTISTCLHFWVSYPIERIVSRLKSDDPDILTPLLNDSTEFGAIAHLVEDFIAQQSQLIEARDFLENVVEERTQELRDANERLSRSYEAVIAGWGRALDLRDHETEGHCIRVTEMTLRLAKSFGFDDDEIMHIERGALLHDIGKMGVPDSILLKEGSLTDSERELMQMHTVYAHEMLYPIEFLRPALDIPFCHHEKWDGTGYPRGLTGENIPLSARIFAVADVSDALLSDRPYRAAWPAQRVRDHIRKLSGSHFDPRIVHIYLQETIGDEDTELFFEDDGPSNHLRLAA